MSENGKLHRQWSRRRVLGVSAAAVGVAAFGGWATTSAEWLDAEPWRFDVVHDDSVYVTMTAGERFTVVVVDRASGTALERHEGVTAMSIRELDSAYVQFVDQV